VSSHSQQDGRLGASARFSASRPLGDRVFAALRQRVKGGEIAPGEWLREQHLVAELGVSRSPVRRALDRLCAEGLAEHVPQRGTRVLRRPAGPSRVARAPVDLRRLSDQVCDELLARILRSRTGYVKTSVAELAKELDVSRTPVQRAVDRLSGLGLVECGRRKGVLFGRVDAKRIAEVYDVRAVLEVLAARLAVVNMCEALVRELSQENDELLALGAKAERSRFIRQEFRLHQSIADAADQAYLLRTLSDIFDLMRAFQRAGYRAASMARRAVREHGLILDAIRRRDGKLAEGRMLRHVRSTCRQVLAATQSRESQDA